MDTWFRERCFRRQLREVMTAALTGKTPAADRIYPGRNQAFLDIYGDDLELPALALYAPTARRDGKGNGRVEDHTQSVGVAAWIRVPHGMADPTESARWLENALDDIVEPAIQALRESAEFVKLVGQDPSFTIEYGIEPESHSRRYAVAGISVDAKRRRDIEHREWEGPLAETTPLNTIAVSIDNIGPHGTTTDDDGGPDGTIDDESRITLET